MNQLNSDNSDPDDYESSWVVIARIVVYALAATGLVALCAAAGLVAGR